MDFRAGEYVRTDDDLIDLWRTLMGPGGFSMSSVWIIFLDDDGRVSPMIVPVDDLPPRPDDTVAALQSVLTTTLDDLGLTSVAFLLSRPGHAAMTAGDRAWARALLDADDRRLTEWPVHLATPGRVRVFAADDLLRSA